LSIRNLASVDLKADEDGLLSAALELGRPVDFFSRSELREVEVPNPSARVQAQIGVSSVCEAAAIRSADSGRLLVTKRKTPNVTLAVARVAYRW
jgi:cobalamin biosynthesis protein CbiG